MDGVTVLVQGEGKSKKRDRWLSGYTRSTSDNYIDISSYGGKPGNSVIRGNTSFLSFGVPISTDYIFPNNDNNIINYILNNAGDTYGTEFINLKYLNINKQIFAQNWSAFTNGPSAEWMTTMLPSAAIQPLHIQLDLSKQTNLEELHMQMSPVASIYFNNGFETGYYPETYDNGDGGIFNVSQVALDSYHNDFAYMPNLRVVDTRWSQLFAHVNFSYNDKLEKLYVGRGYFQYADRWTHSRHVFLPTIRMIDEGLEDIVLNEATFPFEGLAHHIDNQTIVNHSDVYLMPPTFDFKANPTALKEVWVLGEKVGGSALVTSLDRKGSGSLTAGCHNCDAAVEAIKGPATGNYYHKTLKMDIGSPLELVSMEQLNDINLRIWTNGAIGVDTITTTPTSNDLAGKSHVYFGRADVTLASSTHGNFFLTTESYTRDNSSIGDVIDTQSEIYNLNAGLLAATGIVPGARLSEISFDGGVNNISVATGPTAENIYVVSVNETSIKLSRDLGLFFKSLVKDTGYANLTGGTVTQGNQGANIVYAVHALNQNEITITGSDLRLKFTMNNPDWTDANMSCQIRSVTTDDGGVNGTVENGYLIPRSATPISGFYSIYHPAILGQFQVASDIVLHFGSQVNLDLFVQESGMTIDASGKMTSLPTDSRYNFGTSGPTTIDGAYDPTSFDTYPKTIKFETKNSFTGVGNAGVAYDLEYEINIYCVI